MATQEKPLSTQPADTLSTSENVSSVSVLRRVGIYGIVADFSYGVPSSSDRVNNASDLGIASWATKNANKPKFPIGEDRVFHSDLARVQGDLGAFGVFLSDSRNGLVGMNTVVIEPHNEAELYVSAGRQPVSHRNFQQTRVDNFPAVTREQFVEMTKSGFNPFLYAVSQSNVPLEKIAIPDGEIPVPASVMKSAESSHHVWQEYTGDELTMYLRTIHKLGKLIKRIQQGEKITLVLHDYWTKKRVTNHELALILGSYNYFASHFNDPEMPLLTSMASKPYSFAAVTFIDPDTKKYLPAGSRTEEFMVHMPGPEGILDRYFNLLETNGVDLGEKSPMRY